MDEIEEKVRRGNEEARREREYRDDREDRRVEHERWWREHVAELTAEALSSFEDLGLRVEERVEGARINRVSRILATWRAAGCLEPIDALGEWTPADYWILRRFLRDQGGTRAYQDSRHWKQKSRAQREDVVYCERCGTIDAIRHAHHLHYETVGCERLRVDLMTLCERCHLELEHGLLRVTHLGKDEIPF